MEINDIKDKYAIVRILLLIMEADGIIHPKEVEYLEQVLKTFSITEKEISDIQLLDFMQCKSVIQAMPEGTKAVAIDMFNKMAKCDGFVDEREIVVIQSIGL